MRSYTLKLGRGTRLAFLAAIVLIGPAQSQTYSCASASHEYAVMLKNSMVRLVTASTDSQLVATRTRYQLPTGAASIVSVETKKAKCTDAAQAYHQELHPGQPAVSRQMVLIKVGNTRWVTVDPQDLINGRLAYIVFTSQWAKLAVFD